MNGIDEIPSLMIGWFVGFFFWSGWVGVGGVCV